MLSIFIYTIATILSIFLLGYGITHLLLPHKLKPFVLWLMPWVLFLLLIVFLVVASLSGFSVHQSSPFLTVFLIGLSVYAFMKKKERYVIKKKDGILAGLIVISLIFHTSPLLVRDRFLTSVSYGNNDIIAYATVSDYLVNHTIFESFHTDVTLPISNLLNDGYRWGTPIIESFFLNILHLQGYQYTYLFEVILFSLIVPLAAILLEVLYKKSTAGLILVSSLIIFNANMIYMLYNNFLGQVLFWGIGLFILILFFSYFGTSEEKTKKVTKYDILLGLSIGAMYLAYHEPAIFIFLPIVAFFVIRTILRDRPLFHFYSLVKMTAIAFIISSISIFNAIIFDFGQAFRVDPNQPIGWQLFRSKLPYANPFEMMGFYSIHNFEPMNSIIALTLSLAVVFVIALGFYKSKQKKLVASFLIVYVLFYYWTGIQIRNFFAYNRAVTYTLPLLLILFTMGILSLLNSRPRFKNTILFFLLFLVVFSGINLNKLFIARRLSVDRSFISLAQLKNKNINEPIYPESSVSVGVSIWSNIWTGYFIHPYIKNQTLPTKFIDDPFANPVPDGRLVLVSKQGLSIRPTQLLLKNIIWENKFFILGRICNSTECLLKREEDLSVIEMGRNTFEDSLLISGWGIKEGNFRWADSKESTLRLVSKNPPYSRLVFEGFSLKTPQTIEVYFDNAYLGSVSVGTKKKTYELLLKKPTESNVHKILFKYSHLYKQSDSYGSSDTRGLAVNFTIIALQ